MIQEVPEVPLVVSDKVQELTKTKEAVLMLKKHRAWTDVLKVGKFISISWLASVLNDEFLLLVRVYDNNDSLKRSECLLLFQQYN